MDAPVPSQRKRRLAAALAIALGFFAIEVAGGLISGSVALLADAAHMFTDAAALILAYAAMSLAERKASSRHTFGLYRAEILAAFVNAELLLVMSAGILWHAWQRLRTPQEVETGLMLGVAVAGLVANLVSMRLLRGTHQHSLNVHAAYLEVAADALSSAAVIAAALLMPATGWLWLDPAVSIAIALFIVPRTLTLLRRSAHILLEGTPIEVDLEQMRSRIRALPGVEAVHDLHFWTLTSGVHSASVHISAAADSPRGDVLRAVQGFFKDEGVEHVTVQVEWGTELTCFAEHL